MNKKEIESVASRSLEPSKKTLIVNQNGIVLLQDEVGRTFSVETSLQDGTKYLKWLDKDA